MLVEHLGSPYSPEDLALPATLAGKDHIPWKGVKILITKQGEQRKGEPAVVDNVLCNQDTPSGLKINVQFMNYNPNMPFQKALFDYDDIIELKYVYLFYQSSNINNKILVPKKNYINFSIHEILSSFPILANFFCIHGLHQKAMLLEIEISLLKNPQGHLHWTPPPLLQLSILILTYPVL